MTDLTISAQPPNRAIAERPDRRRTTKVTGKLHQALSLVVNEGMTPLEAAVHLNYSTTAMRKALERPHVLKHLRALREVLRASASAQNIHRAIKLRDTSENAMAQLGAMKFIEQLGDDQVAATSRQSSPGIVIQVVGTATIAPQQSAPIEHQAGDDDCPT